MVVAAQKNTPLRKAKTKPGEMCLVTATSVDALDD
jgi:hypothetical protein